jgi:predicted Rossmann fold nucleotide-binding protein DprA/Smf involved in DNA uptake
LLRDGAIMIAEVADAFAIAGVSATRANHDAPEDPTLLAVWDALDSPALDLDALATRAALPARRCLAAVTTLELEGRIECALTGEIRRRGTLANPFGR